VKKLSEIKKKPDSSGTIINLSRKYEVMKKQILAPSILALFVASAAHAGATFDTAAGSLYLGGDVEFDYTSETDTNLGAGGRILVDINGEKALDNGTFAGFKVNPTWSQEGEAKVDDLWVQVGVKNDWSLKAGNFEATDLSVAGQDTYVASVGTATMYRAKDARGRVTESNGGQLTFNKTMDDAGFELTARSTDDGDTLVMRPVVTYAADSLSFAVGAEVPVMGNEGDDDWYGVGATTTLQATDALSVTLRAAFKSDDDADVDSMTAGIGAQYQNFFAAVLYGEDDADVDTSDAEEFQYYASYKIPAVMDIDNFDIYLAAAYSEGEVNGVDADDVVGARIRLKYIF
jgi:hypothetical protein